MLIPVLPRRRFDFGYLAASASQSVTLHPAVDVSAAYYVQLWVRLLARDMAAGQTLVFSLYNTVPDDDDKREFVEGVFFDLTLTSSSPSAVPSAIYREGSSPGPFIKLVLTATQSSASAPPNFYLDLSAVMTLRPA